MAALLTFIAVIALIATGAVLWNRYGFRIVSDVKKLRDF